MEGAQSPSEALRLTIDAVRIGIVRLELSPRRPRSGALFFCGGLCSSRLPPGNTSGIPAHTESYRQQGDREPNDKYTDDRGRQKCRCSDNCQHEYKRPDRSIRSGTPPDEDTEIGPLPDAPSLSWLALRRERQPTQRESYPQPQPIVNCGVPAFPAPPGRREPPIFRAANVVP